MMKILYIDPFSSLSHVNFNKMHIEAIYKITRDIHFVFKEDYYREVGVQSSNVCYTIPSSCIKRNNSGLINRFYMCLVLWKIRMNVPLIQYDKIIFAAYEEISLFFAFYSVPLFLINHNNISGLDNKVKRFFFKAISKRNTHIVLESYIKDYLNSLGISKVEVVHHGLISSYSNYSSNRVDALWMYRKFLFSPSMLSTDVLFMKNLIEDKMFLKYLEEHDLFLILRSKILKSSSNRIRIFSDYLSKEDYRWYFLNATAILLFYPKSFKYRVSGVLLESISCGKKTILSDIKAFRQYENLFGANAYFSSIEDLLKSIEFVLTERNEHFPLSVDLRNAYMPNYSAVLK